MKRTRTSKNGDVMTCLFVEPTSFAKYKQLCADRKVTVSAEYRQFVSQQVRRAAK